MSTNKKTKYLPNRHVFGRMNFLYQASMLMGGKNNKLSANYGQLCKNVGKKSVVRLEPNIKRTLCKKCGIALNPNSVSKMYLNEHKKTEIFITKCDFCKFERKFLVNEKYEFWLENSMSVVEVCE